MRPAALQIALVAFAFVHQLTAGYDVRGQVRMGNVAAGISYGLVLVSIGLLTSNTVLKSRSVVAFLVWTVLGFGILTASHLAIDRLVLPMQKLAVEIVDDHNWGAALLHGVVTLGIVICVNSFYRYQLLCGDEYL